MSDPLKENTSVITITNWKDFHKLLVNSHSQVQLNAQVVQWVNMGSTINTGCGCTRKERENAIDAGYKSMGIYLDNNAKAQLKVFYAAEKIILKHEELEFLSF